LGILWKNLWEVGRNPYAAVDKTAIIESPAARAVRTTHPMSQPDFSHNRRH